MWPTGTTGRGRLQHQHVSLLQLVQCLVAERRHPIVTLIPCKPPVEDISLNGKILMHSKMKVTATIP